MEKIRKNKKISVVLIVVSVIFAIYSFSLAVVPIWGLIMSLKEPFDYLTDKMAFPKPMQFSNYIYAFEQLRNEGLSVEVMLFNSIWHSIGGTFLTVFACLTAGYVCAKYRYTVCKIWYWTVIATMMIPIVGSLGASVKLSIDLGIYNNPATLVSSYSAVGSQFVIMFAFFKGVDWGYAEAAFIDGAGHTRVFFQIMVPQAISPVIALSLTIFISKWGDAQGPIIYLPDYPTLASGFYEFQTKMAESNEKNFPALFAGLFMVSLPIIILYIAFQDKLMSMNIGGGLKG